MKIEIKNYNIATNYFIEVPYYTFKDCIKKNDLIINPDNIIQVEKLYFKKKFIFYKIYLESKNHNGYIRIFNENANEQLSEKFNISNIEISSRFELAKGGIPFPKMFLMHPIFTSLIFLIVNYLLFTGLLKFHPLFVSPSQFTNAQCNVECVKLISYLYYVEIFIFFIGLGPVLIFLDYLLIRIKKIKNIQMHNMLKGSAVLMVPIYLSLMFNQARYLSKENQFKQLAQGYKILKGGYNGNPSEISDLLITYEKMIKYHLRKR